MSSSVKPLPWSEAVRVKDSRERAEFLESHLELVKYLALRVAARLPSSVELDDLVHDGILYSALNFAGKILRTNVATGATTILLSGLNGPQSIVLFPGITNQGSRIAVSTAEWTRELR